MTGRGVAWDIEDWSGGGCANYSVVTEERRYKGQTNPL